MVGKYEKLDVLGSGATGIVYLARDTLMNRQVALKVMDLHSAEEQSVLEEARLLDRLRHPNIVRVNGVDRVDGLVLIDMELVRGQNLQQMLRSEGGLDPKTALRITRDVLSALQYAHGMHVIHRDIKPGNILIDKEGSARLADFGQADILATNAYAQGAGTFAYMAPEDFLPDARSDAQSDLWAVGVTLYEMLCGSRPYSAANVRSPFSWKDALEKHSEITIPTDLQQSLPSLLPLLRRAMARDKAERFINAQQFLGALAPVEEDIHLAGATTVIRPPVVEDDSACSMPGTVATRPIDRRTGLPAKLAVSGDRILSPAIARTSAAVPAIDVSTAPVRFQLAPNSINFGSIRCGQTKLARIRVKVSGNRLTAPIDVTSSDESIVVTPTVFEETNQTLTVQCTGPSEQGLGNRAHKITIRSQQGHVELPVTFNVAPERPRFGDVALWYLPALVLAILPTVAVVLGSPALGVKETGTLAPSAAALGLFFGIMLCTICIGIGTGLTERVVAGSAGAMMGGVLTTMQLLVDSAPRHHPSLVSGLHASYWILGVAAGFLFLQFITYRWHILWRLFYLGFAFMANGAMLAMVYRHHI